MRIAIASVQVPFVRGGAETLAAQLCQHIAGRGHDVDVVTLPFKWYPPATLLDSMSMAEKIDLSEVNGDRIDRVIALKFPVYLLSHPSKVVWLLHQHRQAHDLWGTPHGDLHGLECGERVRRIVRQRDRRGLGEARSLFSISRNTAERLRRSVGLAAEVLYHPPASRDLLGFREQEDFVFYPSRIDTMKRQELLVRAAARLRSGTRILLAGTGSNRAVSALRRMIEELRLENRVRLLGFISEEEKADLYGRCLAVYFGAVDEDYGYVTLEAFLSAKPVIVHPDAGGPLEFVRDGANGRVVEAEAADVARCIDGLAADRRRAREMGVEGLRSLDRVRLDWDHVVDRLLA